MKYEYSNQANPCPIDPQDLQAELAKMKGLAGRPFNFLLDSVRNTFARIAATIERKNRDYAGDAQPFKNFESCQRAGISVQSGIFVRFLDKVTRLENLLDGAKTTAVADESVDDTIDDAIGYLACLKARREYEKPAMSTDGGHNKNFLGDRARHLSTGVFPKGLR